MDQDLELDEIAQERVRRKAQRAGLFPPYLELGLSEDVRKRLKMPQDAELGFSPEEMAYLKESGSQDLVTGAAGALPIGIGAIRKTPTGKLLGTVSKEALELGEAGVQNEMAEQALKEGLESPRSLKEALSPVAPPESPIDRLKNRFGDNPDMHLAIDRLLAKAQKKNQPYEVLTNVNSSSAPKGILGVVPNYDAVPTGRIGKPGFEKVVQKDPFQWADEKYGATKELLRKHADEGMPVEIHTSSDLIATTDYRQYIPKMSKVNLYLPRGRYLDPGHPSAKRLIDAARALRESGVNVEIHPPQFSYTKSEIKRVGSKEAADQIIFRLKKAWNSFNKTGDWPENDGLGL